MENIDKNGPSSARLPFNENLVSFKIKAGTTDLGADYENKITAYFSLLLAQDPSIRGFDISSNDPKYGNFDDLVIEAICSENDKKHIVAIQLKHQYKGKPVNINSFSGSGKDLHLFKYFKETEKQEIPEEVSLVLFTNRKYAEKETNDQLEIFQPKSEMGAQPPLIEFINSKTQSKAHQFKLLKYEDEEKREKFEKFLKRVYLYTSQDDVKGIECKLKHQFPEQSTHKEFLEFIENWSKNENTKFKLNKYTIISKFMECLLWPYSVNLCKDISGQEILFKVFLKFNVTIFEEFISTIQGYDKKFIESKKTKISWKEENQFGLSKQTDVIKLLWHLNELPLIVKCPKETLSRVLNLPENYGRRLVIVGKVDEEFKDRRILKNLSDYNEDEAQECFKDSQINLQGRKWPLLDYVNDSELSKIFRTEEIVRLLLEEEPVFLGEPSRDLFPYIGRFLQKPAIAWEVLEDDSIPDVFVISCQRRKLEIENPKREQVILFEDSCSAQEFREICSRNESENVHHFQITEKKNLCWIFTKGSIGNLEHFRQDKNEVVLDSEIFHSFTNKVSVLCADPGMGKSVLLEFLKQNCPKNLWPIFINIREYTITFKDNSPDRIVDKVIERKYQDLSRTVVELMKNRTRLILLWDGLDEMPQRFYESFLAGVEFISKKGHFQWITARNHLRGMLERKLNVFAFNLTQLNEDNQRFYIRSRLECSDDRENQIMTRLENSLNRELLGIPLQLSILTEIYQKDDGFNFMSMTEMYRKFVEIKFETFSRKMGIPEDNFLMQEQFDKLNKELLPKYQVSGVLACFEEKLLQKLEVTQDRTFLEEIGKTGDERGLVVGLLEDGTPLFVHQTYAEYFCALYLKENISRIGNFLGKVASDDKFQTLRYMLDMLLADGSKPHVAVIYGNVGIIEELDYLPKDLIGRTPVDLACIYNHFGRYFTLEQENKTNTYSVTFREMGWEETEELLRVIKIESKQFYVKKFKSLNIFQYCEKIGTLYPLEVLLRLDNSEANKSRIRNLDIFGKYICTYILCCIRNGFESLLLLVENIPSMIIEQEGTSDNNLLHFAAVYGSTESTVFAKLLETTNLDINAKNNKGNTPLLEAALNFEIGSHKNIRTLVEKGAKIEAIDENGDTVLTFASENGFADIVRYLVEMGAEVNSQDDFGNSPLSLAAQEGHQDIVEFLIGKGADLNLKISDDGCTPILLAAEEGHQDTVNLLIEKGADLNVKNEDNGDTVLLLAVENKFSNRIINKLIEAHVDINAEDEYGNTPLLMLKFYGPEEIANRLILENSVDDIHNTNLGGETLLLRALEKGQQHFVKILLDKGIDLNYKTPEDETLLLLALKRGFNRIAMMLVQKGVNIHARDKNGDCPILVAAKQGYSDVVDILIQKGANPNEQNKDGDTPLFLALKQPVVDVVKILVAAEADVKTQNKKGESPLTFILNYEMNSYEQVEANKSIVKILTEAGADVNTQNKDGESPLFLALNRSLVDIVKTLVEAEADLNTRNKMGDTPLTFVLKLGIVNCELMERNRDIVKILIDAGADVNSQSKYGESPLWLVLQEKFDNEIMNKLIEAGADINLQNKGGDTPLIHALKLDKDSRFVTLMAQDIVRNVMQAGANVNEGNKEGDTPLILAIKLEKDINIVHNTVRNLVNAGANVNAQDKDGHTPLILLLKTDEEDSDTVEEIVKILTDAGADVNTPSTYGNSPLLLAIENKFGSKIVNKLINCGADVNAKNEMDITPLSLLKSNGHEEIFNRLILENENVDEAENLLKASRKRQTDSVKIPTKKEIDVLNAKTPLLLAINSKNRYLAKRLIEEGANPNEKNEDGDTPLILALKCLWEDGVLDIVKILIKVGVHVNAQNKNGDTALMFAVKDKKIFDEAIVNILIQAEADVNAQNNDGNTPLFFVLQPYRIDVAMLNVIRIFIAADANVNVRNKNGDTPLMFALKDKLFVDEVIVNILIQAEADVNAQNNDGDTPLIFALKCPCGDVDMLNTVRTFIEAEANVNAENNNGETPLMCTVKDKDYLEPDIVKILVEAKANVNARNNDGDTPLIFALKCSLLLHNHILNIVRIFIEAGANINAKNRNGDTPLMFAVKDKDCSDSAVVNILLEAKANVNAQNNDGDTPLIVVLKGSSDDFAMLNIVRIFIEAEADVNAENKNGETPLMCAVKDKDNLDGDIVKILVEAKANVNAQNNDGDTPLILALKCSLGDVEMLKIVRIFIEAEANINAENKNGETPLMCAVKDKDHLDGDIVKILVEAKANVNAQNNDGDTPLIFVLKCSLGDVVMLDIVRIFIEAGANVNAKNKNGETPLMFAVKDKKYLDGDIVKILVEAGASVNAQNKDGDTPLILAVAVKPEEYSNVVNTVEILMDAGADVNAQNNDGETALSRALTISNENIVQVLLRDE